MAFRPARMAGGYARFSSHWHHTNDGPAYINKNYASMLPWIDRLFGTLYLPRDKRSERYGIDQPLPKEMLGQLLQPMGLWQSQTAESREPAFFGGAARLTRVAPPGNTQCRLMITVYVRLRVQSK